MVIFFASNYKRIILLLLLPLTDAWVVFILHSENDSIEIMGEVP